MSNTASTTTAAEAGHPPARPPHGSLQAPAGAHLYVRVAKVTRSFGGYVLAQESASVVRVPDFPQEVKIAQPGALLSLAGEKMLSVLARGVHVGSNRINFLSTAHSQSDIDAVIGAFVESLIEGRREGWLCRV